MKMLCIKISDNKSTNLKIGNWYEILGEDKSGYTYRGNHRNGFVLKNRNIFITENQNRKLKLNKINELSRTNL